LKGLRRAGLVALAAMALAGFARQAGAAAELHRLSLCLSSTPTSLTADDLNKFLDDYNRITLESRGLEGLDKISFTWLHQAELRYFVRPNVAVSGGFGQIHVRTFREFLPRIAEAITVRTEVVSVPVHVGAAYYLQPYNQGDFQARAFIGGGFVNMTNSKVLFERLEFATDSATTLGGSTRFRGRRDAPGYYVELGGHMFFASRYSVMIGGLYRGAMVRNLHVVRDVIDPETGLTTAQVVEPSKLTLDLGGLGLRMALNIGF
jgi:hypothetical protein